MNTYNTTYNQQDRKKFSSIKTSLIKAKRVALNKRLKQKPYMSDLEYLLGAFLEMFEPYLVDVVCAFAKRGYILETSSGFGSHNSEYQLLDGDFPVDYVTKNRLEKEGIKIRENSEGKSLLFLADTLDVDSIKKKWLRVVDILPDRGEVDKPSLSSVAVLFRRKYASKNPRLQKQRQFERLDYSVQRSMDHDIKKRKNSNPKPNKIESRLGVFMEELEPQIRYAVLEMTKKGYSIDAAGNITNTHDQMIEGDFRLEEKYIKKLEALNVIVETNPSGYTRLQFTPDKADMKRITRKWNTIVSLLPNKHRIADASMTRKARDFRMKY